MKANVIYIHLVVAGWRSFAKVKVKYSGHTFKKMAVFGSINVSQVLFVQIWSFVFCLSEVFTRAQNFGLVQTDCIWRITVPRLPQMTNSTFWKDRKDSDKHCEKRRKCWLPQKINFIFAKNRKDCENIGEKEKMLVTSIFSFFHNIFKSCVFMVI